MYKWTKRPKNGWKTLQKGIMFMLCNHLDINSNDLVTMLHSRVVSHVYIYMARLFGSDKFVGGSINLFSQDLGEKTSY